MTNSNEEKKYRIASLKRLQTELENKIVLLSKDENTSQKTIEELQESLKNLKEKIYKLINRAERGQIL